MTNIFLRYSHLKDRGIVRSWAELLAFIQKYDFPEGFRPTPNTRAWTEEAVDAWVRSRPSASEAKPPLRGWAKRRAEAKKLTEIQNSRRSTGEPPLPRGRT